jgi:hypothetical protein
VFTAGSIAFLATNAMSAAARIAAVMAAILMPVRLVILVCYLIPSHPRVVTWRSRVAADFVPARPHVVM